MKSPQHNVYPKTEADFLDRLHALVAAYGEGAGGFESEVGMILGTPKPETESGEDRYSKGAYLMRDVAVLAFNYASQIAGASGFQASIAALEAYGSIVGIEHFGVMDMDNLLYPQYDLRGKLEDWITEATPRLREKARAKLAENNDLVSPAVRKHWRYLADGGRP